MSGYVLDHLALTAGLTGAGSEHERREFSRVLQAALEGGPTIAVPAVCLATTAGVGPAVVGHLAELLADAPPGAIELPGLTRTPPLDALRQTFPPGRAAAAV